MPTPRVEIMGNAVRAARTGTDRNGRPYMFVRVACSRSRKNDNGTFETIREIFIDVQCFNVNTEQYVPQQGDKVRAFGELYEEDEQHEGKTYRKIKLDARYVDGWPKPQHQQRNAQYGQQQDNRGQSRGGFGQQDDDEPPF